MATIDRLYEKIQKYRAKIIKANTELLRKISELKFSDRLPYLEKAIEDIGFLSDIQTERINAKILLLTLEISTSTVDEIERIEYKLKRLFPEYKVTYKEHDGGSATWSLEK